MVETTRAKKRLLSGEVKKQELPLDASAPGTRTRYKKENLRRSTTGAKENKSSKIPVVGHRSLPNMGGVGDDSEMEVDSVGFQMDLDFVTDMGIGSSECSSRSQHIDMVEMSSPLTSDPPVQRRINQMSIQSLQMPPPPVPVPKVASPSSRATTELPPSKVSTRSLFLSQTKPEPPLNIPLSQHKLSASITRPPNSQSSSRPPALGMRRSFGTYSSLTPSQTLPEKQRAFKVPLAKPVSVFPATQWSAPAPSDCQPQPKNASYNPVFPTPDSSPIEANKDTEGIDSSADSGIQHRSSSPVPEADSSYGELSFDMDELEETMKKYD